MIVLANTLDEVLETLVLNRNSKLAEKILESLDDDAIEALSIIHQKPKEKRILRLLRRKPKFKLWLKKYLKKRKLRGKAYRPDKKQSRIAKRISKLRRKT